MEQPHFTALPDGSGPRFRLIVGLGNPGRDYERTRHNIGFMMVDLLAERAGASFRAENSWNAEVTEVSGVRLCKPRTFMNRSGESVAAISRFYKIPTEAVLLVIDDVALPLGKLRLRKGGSSGGHNGMQSVIDHLGTAAIARLRIGIGESPGALTGHVLGRFAPDELAAVFDALLRGADAIDHAQAHGFEAAMNKFN